jgi:hypothetical protein
VTNFKISIDWYKNTDWKWVTTTHNARGSFDASIKVPANTPYGMYSGAVVLTRGSDSMVVPVSVAVAAKVSQDASGKITGAVDFGGSEVAKAQQNLTYNNGSVFGPTTGPGEPSLGTGGSSIWTSRRHPQKAASCWSIPVGREPGRTPTSTRS